MKAIEINSKTDKYGRLKIDHPLNKKDRNVRVLILVEEEVLEKNEEKLWMEVVSKSPSFDFLNDPNEEIYSLKDGEPFND